ncbi:ABC transporter substrate-binding protein [Paraburkholderia fungorum]|jgi:phospholipid transport system substrate-binding protein|uniref:MlaC/ttg2D family ABC transporter substrate-binding protein n=1 Tax=Paraburkholderia fungorum TaxID=134537 RepID=UPI0038BE0EC0
MKTLFLILVCSTLLTRGAVADAQVNQSDPQALIETATQQVLDEVRVRAIEPGDIARIRDIVNRYILPYADLHRTTQLAMGRHWKTATSAQQEQVAEQFKMLLIHTYSGAIALLRPDQRIEYPPSRILPTDTDAVVRTIAMSNGQPVEIDYRLYKAPDGWRLYDLNVLGAWLIQTYRQQFNEKIQQVGVEGLIQSLTARNQQLSSAEQQRVSP